MLLLEQMIKKIPYFGIRNADLAPSDLPRPFWLPLPAEIFFRFPVGIGDFGLDYYENQCFGGGDLLPIFSSNWVCHVREREK